MEPFIICRENSKISNIHFGFYPTQVFLDSHLGLFVPQYISKYIALYTFDIASENMRFQKTAVFLLIVVLVQICYYGSNGQIIRAPNCIPLSDCTPIMNMLVAKHFDALPNMSRVELFDYVRRITCGYRESEAFVRCPPK